MRILFLSVVVFCMAGCDGRSEDVSGLSLAKYAFQPQPASDYPVFRLSSASPFATDCTQSSTGFLYVDAEVEPKVARNPANHSNLIAAWQQDRWSSGGARGQLAAYSFDGGSSWMQATTQAPFSRCQGAGNDERASDPWVGFDAGGVAYQLSLTFNGNTFADGSSSAMRVSRSTDGGQNWEVPLTLINDGAAFFNDKGAISGDNTRSGYAYVVWDRLTSNGNGPTFLSRTTDGGRSWSMALPIYDPGSTLQTIGNQITVLPDGSLLNLFTQLNGAENGSGTPQLFVIRSTDQGASWSAPALISNVLSIGASDPEKGTRVRDAGGLADIAVAPDGAVYVVWQDARFSDGQREGIALSRSADGGLSWSEPVQVNGEPDAQAFTPAIAVRDDGIIGVMYYDFRDNDAGPDDLPTSVWLSVSSDGRQWQESRILGPFDLAIAPNARGLFVGDYQGLTSVGAQFVPVLVQSNYQQQNNRSDAYAETVPGLGTAAANRYQAAPAKLFRITDAFQQNLNMQLQRIRLRERAGREPE